MTDLSDGRTGLIAYRSANPFEFTHILRGVEDAPEQRMFGWLLWPEHAPTPAPAIVACHGLAARVEVDRRRVPQEAVEADGTALEGRLALLDHLAHPARW